MYFKQSDCKERYEVVKQPKLDLSDPFFGTNEQQQLYCCSFVPMQSVRTCTSMTVFVLSDGLHLTGYSVRGGLLLSAFCIVCATPYYQYFYFHPSIHGV